MRFTQRIFEIYRDLAKERARERDVNAAEAAATLACFADLEAALAPPIKWETRLALRQAMKDTVQSKYNGLRDPALRVFLRSAIEYLQSRLIDVPRIIYIPWTKGDAAELVDWAERWRKFDEDRKRFDVYCFGEQPFADVHRLAQVYILGHGGPGLPFLSKTNKATPPGLTQQQSKSFTDTNIAPVNFTVLYSRMHRDGLRSETFAGAFKVYACSGGAEGEPNALFSHKGESFVVSFARHMRAKGFINCAFYGYSQDLAAPTSFALLGTRSIALTDQENQLAMLMARLDVLQKVNLGQEVTPEELFRAYVDYKKAFLVKPKTKRVEA